MTKTTSKAVAKAAAPPVTKGKGGPEQELFLVLEKKRGQIRQLLPKSVNVDTFIAVCKTAVLKNPDLASADRRTFFVACMESAKDGLIPDGKDAVLNVYKTNTAPKGAKPNYIKAVQYLPMAGGMVKKLYAGGNVTYVDAACVYEKDEFAFERGDTPRIIHVPDGGADPGPVVAAYAIVELKGGQKKREVMFMRDILKVRNSSKQPDGLMWGQFFDQAAIKSVLKRIYKQLPKVPEFERLIEIDNDLEGSAETFDTDDINGAVPAAAEPDEDTEEQARMREELAAKAKPKEMTDGLIGDETSDGLRTMSLSVPGSKALEYISKSANDQDLDYCRGLAAELTDETEKKVMMVAITARAKQLRGSKDDKGK